MDRCLEELGLPSFFHQFGKEWLSLSQEEVPSVAIHFL